MPHLPLPTTSTNNRGAASWLTVVEGSIPIVLTVPCLWINFSPRSGCTSSARLTLDLLLRQGMLVVDALFLIGTAWLGLSSSANTVAASYGISDKLLHFSVFFMATILFDATVAPESSLRLQQRRQLDEDVEDQQDEEAADELIWEVYIFPWITSALLLTASLLSEILQPILSGSERHFDAWDILFNLLGVTLALILLLFWRRRTSSHHQDSFFSRDTILDLFKSLCGRDRRIAFGTHDSSSSTTLTARYRPLRLSASSPLVSSDIPLLPRTNDQNGNLDLSDDEVQPYDPAESLTLGRGDLPEPQMPAKTEGEGSRRAEMDESQDLFSIGDEE